MVRKILGFLWRFKFVVYIILLLGIGFSVGALELTMNSKFCGSCHEMDYVYKTWSKSTHATYHDEHMRAGCMDCHAKPGLIGLLEAKFGNGSKSAFYHVLYMFKPKKERMKLYQKVIREHAHAPHEACLKCHTDLKERAKSMYVPHHAKDDEIRDEKCSKCHQFVVHTPKGYEPPRKLEICYNCHDKEGVEIDSCETCHVGQAEIRKGKGAKGVEGEKDVMLDDVGCTDCHSNSDKRDFKVVVQSCVDCHDGDESYGKPTIEEWQNEVKEKLSEIKKELIELQEQIKLARRKGKDVKKAEELYNKIKFNFKFVSDDRSFGVHNHEYTMNILESIENDIKTLKEMIK